MRPTSTLFLAVLAAAVSGCELSMPEMDLPPLGAGTCSAETQAFVEAEESRLFADFLEAQAKCVRRVSGTRDYCDTWVDYQELRREIRDAVIRGNGLDCLPPQPYDGDLGHQPPGYDRGGSPLRVLDGAFAKAGITPYDR